MGVTAAFSHHLSHLCLNWCCTTLPRCEFFSPPYLFPVFPQPPLPALPLYLFLGFGARCAVLLARTPHPFCEDRSPLFLDLRLHPFPCAHRFLHECAILAFSLAARIYHRTPLFADRRHRLASHFIFLRLQATVSHTPFFPHYLSSNEAPHPLGWVLGLWSLYLPTNL